MVAWGGTPFDGCMTTAFIPELGWKRAMRFISLSIFALCAIASPTTAQSANRHFPMAPGPLAAGAVDATG